MVNAAGHPFLQIDGVGFRYGSFAALEDITVSIDEGEFVTLLGPSGCGKTTLLRIVAGFVRPTVGRLILEGREMSKTPAHLRPFNIVFQRPTLFPHLDVFGNVAFGLRMKGVAKHEIRRRVGDALSLIRLEGIEDRRSHELSGGQMQRVCLARALVNSPRLLLLDEPLSALDRQIKLDMQAELRRVHRETGCTFLYVTHDQQEALAMSDRIALLNNGKLEQLGTPAQVFQQPASAFAARFVDANVLPVVILADGESPTLVSQTGEPIPVTPPDIVPGPAWLVVRPEAVRLGASATPDGITLPGTVRDVSYQGTAVACQVEVPLLAASLKVVTQPSSVAYEVGSEVTLSWDVEDCRILPGE